MDQLGPAPDGQGRDHRLQGDLGRRQFGPIAGGAGQGGAQGPRHGRRQKRRGRIRSVVDIGVQQPFRPSLAAHQADGVDVQHQGRLATILVGLGVDDDRLAERQLGLMHAVGMLVQEVAEVRGRLVGGADGEKHFENNNCLCGRSGGEWDDGRAAPATVNHRICGRRTARIQTLKGAAAKHPSVWHLERLTEFLQIVKRQTPTPSPKPGTAPRGTRSSP
jgi:hypothetical protein